MQELIFLIAGLGLLIWSGEKTVKAVLRFSRVSGISEIAAGFLLVAVTTSIPELGVAVVSSIQGVPEISIGNIFGSNIANILLVFGLVMLISRVSFEERDIAESKRILVAASAVSLPLVFIDAWWGFALVCLYIFWSFCRKTYTEGYGLEERKPRFRGLKSVESAKSCLSALFFVSLVLLSSKLVVESAVELVKLLGVSKGFIGSTVIAVGTSLPELVVAVSAVKRSPGILIGDILGSVLANSTLILAFTSIVSPVVLDIPLRILVLVSITVNIFFYFAISRSGKILGAGMLLAYLFFIYGWYLLS
ncbi:MAG: sodium:calcium antiporter [Candidatus Micrarchaeota archaeon]|nr:sodium:calcium antiporter [Candidatus Micrarchaeota archaeon]